MVFVREKHEGQVVCLWLFNFHTASFKRISPYIPAVLLCPSYHTVFINGLNFVDGEF